MGASSSPLLAHAKPEPRARAKGRKDRLEQKIEKQVRSATVDRDNYCRLFYLDDGARRAAFAVVGECSGRSQFAHFAEQRRFKTRGQEPAARHVTHGALQLCAFHHGEYDGHRMEIEALTPNWTDGRLQFSRDGHVWREDA